MPRWLLWMPLAALTLAFAMFGLRAGWQVASLTESDVINRAAQNYIEGGQGRALTDCSAEPAQTRGIWLYVTCMPKDGRAQTYRATRLGGVSLLPHGTNAPEA